jgi:hypothetical protein
MIAKEGPGAKTKWHSPHRAKGRDKKAQMIMIL